MSKVCKDLCKKEPWKHCHWKRYEQGYMECVNCVICYKPGESQPPRHCYCCGIMLRSKPQNKRNYQHHLVYIE